MVRGRAGVLCVDDASGVIPVLAMDQECEGADSIRFGELEYTIYKTRLRGGEKIIVFRLTRRLSRGRVVTTACKTPSSRDIITLPPSNVSVRNRLCITLVGCVGVRVHIMYA